MNPESSKNVVAFDTSAQLINETKLRYKLAACVDNPDNLTNLINLVNNANNINENGDQNPKSLRDGGYGLQVGNSGNRDDKLPNLPSIDRYEKQVNREKTNNPEEPLPKLPTQNPYLPSSEKEEKNLKSLMEDLKSRDIAINETASRIDQENNRFLVYVLAPFRPDDKMRELSFRFVSQSKDGFLYEKPVDMEVP